MKVPPEVLLGNKGDAMAYAGTLFRELYEHGMHKPTNGDLEDPSARWEITDFGMDVLESWDRVLGILNERDGSFVPHRAAQIIRQEVLSRENLIAKLRNANVVPEGLSDNAIGYLLYETLTLLEGKLQREEIEARISRRRPGLR